MVLTYDNIVEETEGAVYIQFGEVFGENSHWIPRSCIINLDTSVNEIEVLDWIVFEKDIRSFNIGN